MLVHLTGLTSLQAAAAAELSELLGIGMAESGIPVHFQQTGSGLEVRFDGTAGSVSYSSGHQWARGLSLITGMIRDGQPDSVTEHPAYDQLGFMIDCSRNAVLRPEAYQEMVKRAALMGYSAIQLYTEETYEIEGYPYFGYMRGRYTAEQLKSMDFYAEMFGIELVPCIQTLAHLGQTLRWNAHADMVDYQDILLIDEEKSYRLIEEMFRTMSENLRSRTIHIGMDEAHMMGLGKYLDKHGYKDRTSLMLKHFNRVVGIARSFGYQPMMWSDMFFRLASGGEYYDEDSKIRPEVSAMIPEDVKLVYWDYYSEEPGKYDAMLKKHKQLCSQVVFAGGAWKWMGFSPNNHFSHHTGRMAHDSCVANGIREVLLTTWGDNGAEASVFSILPSLQLWAELCYRGSADEEWLRHRFAVCAGGVYDDFMDLDLTMLVPDNPAPGGMSVNPPKYLLYQDILYGLFDKHVMEEAYPEHFRRCASVFGECIKRNPAWHSLFQTQYALSRLLELKCDAGINIRKAYREQDRGRLAEYSQRLLPELFDRAEEFIAAYRRQWTQENKIFGYDVFDLRMGGLLQRIRTAVYRIEAYLNGSLDSLEELEEDILSYNGREGEKDGGAISVNLWHLIATPSVLAGV